MAGDEAYAMFLGWLFGILIGMALTLPTMDASWRHWAIEKGVAEYDSKTGQWKEIELKVCE